MTECLPPNYVACSDGHGPVFHRDDIDCPACKEISKKLTEVNARDIEIAKLKAEILSHADTDMYSPG